MDLPPKVIEKFWKNVDKTPTRTGCWNWTGILCQRGLPIIQIYSDKKFIRYSPRRVSLMISGKNLSKRDQVQPLTCKNKLCVNPLHLVSGDVARFWAKVYKLKEEDGGCWVWIASQDSNMYGRFSIHENWKVTHIRAHVYSWQLFTGRPVPKGLFVCHKCDHPYCVNPDHLFLGTTQDNTNDMVEKGRQARGEKNRSAILTENKVKEIRELRQNGISVSQLSSQFGVKEGTIYDICSRSWKHIA